MVLESLTRRPTVPDIPPRRSRAASSVLACPVGGLHRGEPKI